MEQNRPRGRSKNISGQKASVHRRGEGLHTGPVGSGGRPSSGGPKRSGGGRGGISVIALILILLFGGGGLGSMLLGGEDSAPQSQTSSGSPALSFLPGGGQGSSGGSGSASGQWLLKANTGVLDKEVSTDAREKRTVIRKDGTDQVTLMVYMCGADLESRASMATYDLQEMAAAASGDQVNIIVYTGGASQWKNQIVSNKKNQIYQIRDGGLVCLKKDAGNASMTDPDTLSDFIRYCSQNFPANRMDLIFWDHGGGSVTGYGYDEIHPGSGSMSLSGIRKALKKGGVTFDFIGFDACLMATVENALMLDAYADYLIASEETEPEVGWYYTSWLSKLAKDPSMSTLEIGKNIADDFVAECGRKCAGQKTTLSVIDLAETAATVPEALAAFSRDTTQLIREDSYKTVAGARSHSREFAPSSSIDQVDLVHLAANMETTAGKDLSKAILGAVKYNQTSSNMTNAYGMSVYFPCRKLSKVDAAVHAYSEIGMDEDYSRCIQAFASMETSGQAASGGTTGPLPSLLGTLGNLESSSDSTDMIAQLIGSLIAGQMDNMKDLSGQNTDYMDQKVLDTDTMAAYIAANHLDGSSLVWTGKEEPVLSLSEADWSLVQNLELNVFADDGEGYLDLGLDNVFDFTEDGQLKGSYDHTWLAVNGIPVAYYFETMVDDGETYTITGHVPALLNGDRVNLLLVFDNDHPDGYVAGAAPVYEEEETGTLAKNLQKLEDGDTLDFLCDYYSYDGVYQDSYMMGEQLTVNGDLTLSNVEIEENCKASYRITDIYQQQYWTETIPEKE